MNRAPQFVRGGPLLVAAAAAVLSLVRGGLAADPPPAPVDFGREIQPIFARKCAACHGPDKAEGGLRLQAREPALARLESGKHAIVPGRPEASVLLERVASADPDLRMPPEGKPLSPAEIAALRRWIAQGADWQAHWAFRPVTRPPVPAVRNAAWVRTPIDRFVLARLETRQIAPSADAEPAVLARRLSFDLIGLPPPPEAVARFVAASRTDRDRAYADLVEGLLASPQYGEKWARHWLDVVRFAETNSFERDGAKPHAWRYRDYVIQSLNADKPYDQFLREQLAGDELPEPAPEAIIATGFYRLGVWDDEPADRLLARYDGLDDIVTTVGQGVLGLTVNCARCHDHKIDPVPQRDYYSLLAFFHNVTPNNYENPQVVRPVFATPAARAEFDAAVARRKQREDNLQAERTAIENDFRAKARSAGQTADLPKNGGDVRQQIRALGPQLLGRERTARYEAVHKELEELSRQRVPADYALCVSEHGPQPPETFVLLRGNPQSQGPKVEPAFPEALGGGRPRVAPPPPGATTSGRRLALAQWVTAPDNRLTARVIVNRLWQHHFGRGIVRSPNNFGQLGELPTHPELLDWLATELVRHGWRLKPLHRQMVLSSAYRQSSRGRADALATDPANDLFWRWNSRRLSAEELRDAVHVVTGQFNARMFGPGVYPDIPREVLQGQSQPGSGWGKSPPAEQARRSVYIHVKRSLITPLLSTFDFPETDSSCEARFVTTQPGQALSLLNGEFLHQQAGALAGRLRRDAGDELRSQVGLALRLALSRDPGPAEIARGLKLVEDLRSHHGQDAGMALQTYCLFVLNLNEFVHLD